MAEPARPARDAGAWTTVKKRWRAWLRAVHRDFGYLAIGFTVIYAISGIAQNHIEEWGDVSYRTYEEARTVAAVPDGASDAAAIAQVAALVDFGTPTGTFRAGDEVRLEYANGAKVTVIGTQATIQGRERRTFIGAANWLHTARQKKGWKYVADAYAVMLLYLAISGIFMIKGKLGLRWRGTILISIGVAVPVAAVMLSGPGAQKQDQDAKARTADQTPAPGEPGSGITFLPPEPDEAEALPVPAGSDGSGITFLPPESDDAPAPAGSAAPPQAPAKPRCDPFGSMRGCDTAGPAPTRPASPTAP